jgi:predicted transcriptional regulator
MSDQLHLELTAQIVSAQIENNDLAAAGLPALIQTVYRTVAGLGQAPVKVDHPEPAVAIKKSVFPSHIVCLECGKTFKMLKRHLTTDHGLTPADYRNRWNLPSTYQMVASDYAAKRSALAQAIGLGRRVKGKAAKPVAKAASVPVVAKRGRKPVSTK